MGPTEEMPRVKYLNLSKGRVVEKVNGEKVMYPGYEAFLVGYTMRTGEEAKFGTELHLLLEVNGRPIDMGMLLKSGYARHFMRTMLNLDLEKPVAFYPEYKEDENGKYGWLVMYQDGKRVPSMFPTNNLGECPDKEVIDDGTGKTTANYAKQITFLKNLLETEMHSRFEKAAAVRLQSPAATTVNDPPASESPAAAQSPGAILKPITSGDNFEDDLPF